MPSAWEGVGCVRPPLRSCARRGWGCLRAGPRASPPHPTRTTRLPACTGFHLCDRALMREQGRGGGCRRARGRGASHAQPGPHVWARDRGARVWGRSACGLVSVRARARARVRAAPFPPPPIEQAFFGSALGCTGAHSSFTLQQPPLTHTQPTPWHADLLGLWQLAARRGGGGGHGDGRGHVAPAGVD